MTERLSLLASLAAKAEARRDVAVAQLEGLESQVSSLEEEEGVLTLVEELFRKLVDREVSDATEVVQDLLTEGLQSIFEDMDLSVSAEVDIQRGKVSVSLATTQKHPDGTTTQGSAMDAYGGSVSAVQSVLLRVIVLRKRGLRPLLILDESLGAVAEHYVTKVGEFLSVLCDKMGMDILAVSHNPAMVEAANKAYRIQKHQGEATFKEIS